MVEKNSTLCPSDNQQVIDQSGFWSSDGIDWDTHRIGWLIAGVCAAVTVVLTAINVGFHATHYTNRGEQRQIIRILYMPAVYAIISFFSYRFFRSYTYYDLIETAYESVTLSAFLLLLIEFVAATAAGHSVDNAILRKDKEALPLPFCCWRYRPTKAYFMYTVKWSVLQYVILRPLLSIAGIVCEYYGVLCESGPWSFKTAHAYITVIDGVSITIALYGLLIFYGLTKDELKGRKPLSKFMSIKLIVMFTFYQSLVFDALEGRVIKPTQYWTETNIADGLNALAICIEMVIFSAFMMYAYSWREYVVPGRPRTSVWRPLWDSINYCASSPPP
ncbi:organic solute transporter subunit alpha/Transmembrane protein [Trametes polyzona]|nr:organic solute transporter subunit alpha/Transmembrane protein [Trametes polyzona]